MKRLPGVIEIVCLFCFVAPGTAKSAELTLSEYVSQVREANPGLRAARERAESLRYRVSSAAVLDDPFFAMGLDEIPFGGGGTSSISYQLSQTIPFPLKLGARSDSAQARAESAHADFETGVRTLTVLASQTYFRTLYSYQAIALNSENSRLIRDTIESAKARYQTGSATHHDWLLGKVELGVLEAERLRLIREQKSLHALMNELRSQSGDAPLELAPFERSMEKSSDSSETHALAKQPELASFGFLSSAASADERIAKLSYFPDFVVQGMAMQPTMSEMGMGNWGFMVGINVPLYFFWKQSNLVSAAQAERAASQLELRSLENRLHTEWFDAREQLKSAQDIVKLYESEVIPNTEMAVKDARSAYSARRLPLTQYIETLKIQRLQKLEFLAAKIDVEASKIRLAHLLSNPPILRLAPARPSLFSPEGMGTGAMNEGMSSGTSGTVNLGRGMSGPTRRESKPAQAAGGSSGMGNM